MELTGSSEAPEEKQFGMPGQITVPAVHRPKRKEPR